MKRLPHKTSAFTLLEMLMVVALIALMSLLLFPALKRVRERADLAKCTTSLSQIGKGALLFAADNDGLLPGARRLPGQYWRNMIAPYLDLKTPGTQLICPTYKNAGYFFLNPNNYTTACTYSWNELFGFASGSPWTQTRPLRNLYSITAPSKTSLVVDPSGATPTDFNDYYTSTYGLPSHYLRGTNLHQNGFNALFVDGHVEWLSKEWITNRASTDVFWGNPADGW